MLKILEIRKMKKIIPGLILITFLSLLAVPAIVKAQDMVTECTIRTDEVGTTLTEDCAGLSRGDTATYASSAICCAMDKVFLVTNWIFFLVVALSIIFILYGGFLIVAAGGDDARVTKGRMFIMWALIGFAIAILARALPLIIRYFVS